MKKTLYTNEKEIENYENGETFIAVGKKDVRNPVPFSVSEKHLFYTFLNHVMVDTGSDADFDSEDAQALEEKYFMPKVIDRGTDCILKIGVEETRIDKLSTLQLIHLLKKEGLLVIDTVSYDEYEKLNKIGE